MLCWVLRCLLQDSISIPGPSCVGAVGALTAAQGGFPSCAHTQKRWVRLSPTTSSAEVPEVTSGLNLPFVLKHLWSWPELEEIFVEVSYCPSGAFAGCDDIPLRTLPCVLCGSMLLHPHPHWALFQWLVNDCPFLQSQIQPLVLHTVVRQSRAQVLARQ